MQPWYRPSAGTDGLGSGSRTSSDGRFSPEKRAPTGSIMLRWNDDERSTPDAGKVTAPRSGAHAATAAAPVGAVRAVCRILLCLGAGGRARRPFRGALG